MLEVNWDYVNKNRIGICFALCIVALLFIMIGHVYRDQIQLVLKREICKFPECSIDLWSVSHFMLFGLFGFFIPGYPLSFFTMGVGFELVEDFLSSDETTQFADCKNPYGSGGDGMCSINPRKTWCNGFNDGYWYTNHTDSFVNLLGYVVGSAIRTTCVGNL